jgi:hypothetical protein
MSATETILQEQNRCLLEKLEKAYRLIGNLEREVKILKGGKNAGRWKPMPQAEKGGAKVWLWEGGDA